MWKFQDKKRFRPKLLENTNVPTIAKQMLIHIGFPQGEFWQSQFVDGMTVPQLLKLNEHPDGQYINLVGWVEKYQDGIFKEDKIATEDDLNSIREFAKKTYILNHSYENPINLNIVIHENGYIYLVGIYLKGNERYDEKRKNFTYFKSIFNTDIIKFNNCLHYYYHYIDYIKNINHDESIKNNKSIIKQSFNDIIKINDPDIFRMEDNAWLHVSEMLFGRYWHGYESVKDMDANKKTGEVNDTDNYDPFA
jgi:hypothetical protein